MGKNPQKSPKQGVGVSGKKYEKSLPIACDVVANTDTNFN